MGLFGRRSNKSRNKAPASTTTVTMDDGQAFTITTTVDCIGDSCPRPQLMTKSAMAKATSGDIIAVDVDNPTSMEALPAVIKDNGGTHLGTVRQARHWQVISRRD